MSAERAAALLREALDHDSDRERDAFLAQACAGDDALRQRVERLLRLTQARVSTLDDGPLDLAARLLGDGDDDMPALPPGSRVGPFEITGLLGRGGMGEVLAARRVEDGFEQAVAIKRMRGRVNDADALRRFRRERAILAGLEHPGIARFVDGGVDAQGRPWFAMERVDGVPITQWAEQHALDVPARVALIAQVCDAVQAAHARLVVHGDLKPGNVLVDASGRPRLLDFGIARLVDEVEPDAASPAPSPHTPAYAAPEQLNGAAQTIATDVHALGALLYRLLTGALPFEHDDAILLQAQILSTTPAPMSTRVPRAQRAQLAGDLDRIVARCLQKSPEQRYVAAAALADDLRRWLGARPVAATPSTWRYRTRLLLRRQPWPIAAAALVLAVLIAATLFSAAQARRATESAQAAQVANDFLVDLFAAADPGQSRGERLSLREVLDAGAARLREGFQGDAATRSRLATVLARSYLGIGRSDLALPLLQTILPQLPAHGDARAEAERVLAEVYQRLEDFPAAERHGRAALAQLDDVVPTPDWIAARNALAYAIAKQGRFDEALALYRQTEARLPASRGPVDWLRIDLRNDMATVHSMQGDWAGTAAQLDAIADALQTPPPGRERDALLMRMNLAVAHFRIGRVDGVDTELATIAEAFRAHLGENNGDELAARTFLGQVQWQLGDAAACADTFETLLTVRAAALGTDHPLTLDMHANAGRCDAMAGRRDEAERHLAAMVAASADNGDVPSRGGLRLRISAGLLAEELQRDAGLPATLSDTALIAWRDALNLAGSDDDLRLLALRAARREREGDPVAAARLLAQPFLGDTPALRSNPRIAARLHSYRAYLLLQAGNAAAASEALTQARSNGDGATAQLRGIWQQIEQRLQREPATAGSLPRRSPLAFGLG